MPMGISRLIASKMILLLDHITSWSLVDPGPISSQGHSQPFLISLLEDNDDSQHTDDADNKTIC